MAALSALPAAGSSRAAGAHDIRGWEVRTLVDDRVAGTVHDLLLDEDGVLRWLDLALRDGRHVLVPAGQARAEPARPLVRLPGLAADHLALLPTYAYAAESLTPAFEATRLSAYAAALLRETRLADEPPPQAPVVPLASLPEFRVAAGDPDPRGWPLVGAGGERIGRVEELLVDPLLLRARYLVCAVAGDGPQVRVPAAQVQLDAAGELVRAERLTRQNVTALPAWPADGGAIEGVDAMSVRDDARLDPGALFGEEAP